MCANKDIKVDQTMFSCLELDKAFDHFDKEKKSKILVCGKTGIGKSTLLNTMLGQQAFEVGGPDEHNLDPVTLEVTSVHTCIQNFNLEIFDSPGLQDGARIDDKYLRDMHKKCENVDLVLCCVEMTLTRWCKEDEATIELLTQTFGVDLWKKAILVLTKANMHLRAVSESSTDMKKFCQNTFETLKERFQAQLIQEGVSQEVINNIPAVAAGNAMDRHLPYVSKEVSKENAQKPQDYLLELWVQCFERLSGCQRQLFINETEFFDRLERDRDSVPLGPREQDLKSKLEEQKKDAEEKEKEQMKKIAELEKRQQQLQNTCQSAPVQYSNPSPPEPPRVQHIHIKIGNEPCSLM